MIGSEPAETSTRVHKGTEGLSFAKWKMDAFVRNEREATDMIMSYLAPYLVVEW